MYQPTVVPHVQEIEISHNSEYADICKLISELASMFPIIKTHSHKEQHVCCDNFFFKIVQYSSIAVPPSVY